MGEGTGEKCKGKVLTLRPSGPPDLSPFEVINVPLLELEPSLNAEELREVLRDGNAVLFTSATGVRVIASMAPNIINEIINSKKKVFAIGPKTAKELERYGIRAVVPKVYTSEGLAETLKGEGKVIAIRSDKASKTLKEKLGSDLVEIIAYRTIRKLKPEIANMIKEVDAVVVSSAEIGRALLESLEASGTDPKELFSKVPLVVIGPEAAKPLEEAGVPHYVSDEATFDGIRKKLLELLCPS